MDSVLSQLRQRAQLQILTTGFLMSLFSLLVSFFFFFYPDARTAAQRSKERSLQHTDKERRVSNTERPELSVRK